jgi:multidrug resistance efflux pump
VQRIRPGQEAAVTVPALQSTNIPGHVREIKAGAVIVEFDSLLPALRPGMRVNVRFKLE